MPAPKKYRPPAAALACVVLAILIGFGSLYLLLRTLGSDALGDALGPYLAAGGFVSSAILFAVGRICEDVARIADHP